jgi:protein-tyrosine kinase
MSTSMNPPSSPQASFVPAASAGNIGKTLLESGKITEAQAEKILQYQKERGIRFGQAAVDLGFITEKDIAQVLSQQFAYPYLRKGESALDEKLVAAYEPFSGQVEALRSLRTQLMLRWFSQGHKFAQFAGYETGIGASLTVANLGIVFSQLGERTLVMDGNLRKPYQHALFGKANDVGLTDVLAGRASLSCIQKVENLVGLSLLSAGTPAPNPQELLGRAQMAQTMSQLALDYDVVLVDSAPLSFSSDAQLLGAACKGIVLVSRKDYSKARDAVKLHSIVKTTGAEILGVILTEW